MYPGREKTNTPMTVHRALVCCLVPVLALPLLWTGGRPSWAQEASLPEDAASAAALQPSELMLKALPLLQAGKGNEATFWLYAGQLRYRSYLAAHPDLDPTGDPALFSSLFDMIGRPVNEFAFGDIAQLARTMDAVLEWDQRYRDPSLPTATHEATRRGLASLRDDIVARAQSIREERTRNGLPNR